MASSRWPLATALLRSLVPLAPCLQGCIPNLMGRVAELVENEVSCDFMDLVCFSSSNSAAWWCSFLFLIGAVQWGFIRFQECVSERVRGSPQHIPTPKPVLAQPDRLLLVVVVFRPPSELRVPH
jgi:hypothetical protein